MSVTDTTAEDLETTVTEEVTRGDKDPDAVEKTEVTKTNSGSSAARINFVKK